MTNQKGSISIHTENIFPIIKKWLYSDKDIFIRELISNGCDAVNKYKKLISLGEAKGNADENYKIKVSIDKENSALIFEDNGIGMTAEEVEKYINQVAFSGAEDFFNTYKDKMNEENDIIGHFGLGFYSSFMVSKKVQIDTLSYKENATPVRWVSEDGLEFELTQSDNRETRGTTITLFLADDSKEFLEEYTVRNIIDKSSADKVIGILEKDETEMDKNWNKRYRDNMDKMKSGDIYKVADVVRNLSFKQKEKGLSTGEKKMLNNAKQILVSELVLTEHATQDEIEQMVDSKISTSYEEYKVDSNISASDISSDIVSKFIPFNSDDINKKASND